MLLVAETVLFCVFIASSMLVANLWYMYQNWHKELVCLVYEPRAQSLKGTLAAGVEVALRERVGIRVAICNISMATGWLIIIVALSPTLHLNCGTLTKRVGHHCSSTIRS